MLGLHGNGMIVRRPPGRIRRALAPFFLWGENDPREIGNGVPASLQTVAWSPVSANVSNLASPNADAPGPIRVASTGVPWSNTAGVIDPLVDLRLGQVIDVSVLLQRGTSGRKLRISLIAEPGSGDQTASYIDRDASGAWTQTTEWLGDWGDPVVDTVVDASGNRFERIRATFTVRTALASNVQFRIGPASDVAGEYVDIHRVGAHIAVKPADVSVAISQASISAGDVIGTDVTATVTINDAGKPAISLGDVALTWYVNDLEVPAGTALAAEDDVQVVAAWDANGNAGFAESPTISTPGWTPRLWSLTSELAAGNEVNASAQAIFIDDSGGTVSALASPDAYLPAPVTITSSSQTWAGGRAVDILPGVSIGDVVEVSILTRRGTSGQAHRVYTYVGSVWTRFNRSAAGAVNTNETDAGTHTAPVYTLVTGSDGREYERITYSLTSSQAGNLSVRVTPNEANSTIEVYRVGAVLVPAVSPGQTLIYEAPIGGDPAGDFASEWDNYPTRNASGNNTGTDYLFPAGTFPDSRVLAFGNDNGRNYCRIKFEAGSYNLARGFSESGRAGGNQWRHYFPSGHHRELILEYKIRFLPGFQWIGGGKLPGLGALNASGGQNTSGFSFRLMWRNNNNGTGRLVLYAYYADKRLPEDAIGIDGRQTPRSDWQWGENWTFVPSLGPADMNVWHTIQQRIRTNDDNQANAEIEMWWNGVKMDITASQVTRNVIDLGPTKTVTGIQIRRPTDPHLEHIRAATFYGGNTSNFAPTRDTFMDQGDFRVWVP